MATVNQTSIMDEVQDFLLSAPTPEQVIAFHASVSAQDRLRMLLDKNREGNLTAEENAELDEMNFINHFFIQIKARAMKKIKEREVVASE